MVDMVFFVGNAHATGGVKNGLKNWDVLFELNGTAHHNNA